MPTDPTRNLEISERRLIVAQNLRAGVKYRTMAQALGVSLAQIGRDVKAILKELREARLDEAEDHVNLTLDRLDTMLNGVWDKARTGHLGSVDRALKIEQERAKLLGLYEPEEHKHEIEFTDDVDQILEDRLSLIAARLGAEGTPGQPDTETET